jgi:hypothetical protein
VRLLLRSLPSALTMAAHQRPRPWLAAAAAWCRQQQPVTEPVMRVLLMFSRPRRSAAPRGRQQQQQQTLWRSSCRAPLMARPCGQLLPSRATTPRPQAMQLTRCWPCTERGAGCGLGCVLSTCALCHVSARNALAPHCQTHTRPDVRALRLPLPPAPQSHPAAAICAPAMHNRLPCARHRCSWCRSSATR